MALLILVISLCVFLSLNSFTKNRGKKYFSSHIRSLEKQKFPCSLHAWMPLKLSQWDGENEEERNERARLASRKKTRRLILSLHTSIPFPRPPKGNVKRGDIFTYPITNLGKGKACQKAINSGGSKGSGVGVREGCRNRCSSSAHDPICRGEDWLIRALKYGILGS